MTLKDLAPEEKKTLGSELAQAKEQLTQAYEAKLSVIKNAHIDELLNQDIVDITTPSIDHKQ